MDGKSEQECAEESLWLHQASQRHKKRCSLEPSRNAELLIVALGHQVVCSVPQVSEPSDERVAAKARVAVPIKRHPIVYNVFEEESRAGAHIARTVKFPVTNRGSVRTSPMPCKLSLFRRLVLSDWAQHKHHDDEKWQYKQGSNCRTGCWMALHENHDTC
jgi:hypothetical protein